MQLLSGKMWLDCWSRGTLKKTMVFFFFLRRSYLILLRWLREASGVTGDDVRWWKMAKFVYVSVEPLGTAIQDNVLIWRAVYRLGVENRMPLFPQGHVYYTSVSQFFSMQCCCWLLHWWSCVWSLCSGFSDPDSLSQSLIFQVLFLSDRASVGCIINLSPFGLWCQIWEMHYNILVFFLLSVSLSFVLFFILSFSLFSVSDLGVQFTVFLCGAALTSLEHRL